MSMLRLSLTTALVLCAPVYAHAAVDAAGATALNQQIADSLKNLAPLTTNGELSVTPDGDAFAVTLPALVAKSSRDDFSVVVAPISLRMVPVSADSYKYTATLPSPFFTVADATGVPRGTATVKEQQISGEWSVTQHLFNSSLAVLKGVTYTDSKANVTVKVAELGAVNQVTPAANNRVNAQGSLNMRNIEVTHADAERGRALQVKIAALGLTNTVTDYDMTALNRLSDGLRDDKNATPANIIARFGALMGAPGEGGAGGKSEFSVTLTDLLAVGKGQGDARPTEARLALVKLGGTSATDAAGLTHFTAGYEHGGFALTNVSSKIVADLLPASAKFGMSIANLPAGALLQTVADKMSTAADETPRNTARQTIASTAAQMEKAGTTFTISHLDFTSRTLAATTQGSLKASTASPVGGVGTVTARLTGVNELLERLSQAMQQQPAAEGAPQPQQDPNEGAVMMGLSMMQMFGEPVANATPSALAYRFELAQDGTVLLNGKPMAQTAGLVPPDDAPGTSAATKSGRRDSVPAEPLPDLKP